MNFCGVTDKMAGQREKICYCHRWAIGLKLLRLGEMDTEHQQENV
jgi:hypothetical protein